MSTQTLARGLATRTANKNKRRDLILACAGEMIADEGLDALTLSKLAEKADVTIPTVHNLLGKKADILTALVSESMEKVMAAGSDLNLTDPITAVESFVENLIGLLGTNETLYRAAFIAGERIKFFEHQTASGIFARAADEARTVCREAVERGDLQGRIDTDQLAMRLFASQRLARQDWMNGYISLNTYRAQVTTGMFITLCADASPAFKDRLIEKINALSTPL
jgi:AcrR family transcriptional regulator